MGDAYPELRRDKARVAQVLKAEEERFGETLENGMKILECRARSACQVRRQDARRRDRVHALRHLRLSARPDGRRLPRTRRRRSTRRVSMRAMKAQRDRARAACTFKTGAQLDYAGPKTAFRGYESLSEEGRVVALYKDGARVDALTTGERGVVVLDRTPFYAESGGQVGDRGELSKGGACLTLFAVEDTQKIQPDVFGHHRRGEDRRAARRRHGGGARRPRRARPHDAQPLGHAPDAQGAARGAGHARAAEGFAGRPGQDALRLRAQRADDRRRDPARRAAASTPRSSTTRRRRRA